MVSADAAVRGEATVPSGDVFSGAPELWAAIADGDEPARFLAGWLAILAGQLPGAETALLLLKRPEGTFAPSAIWPDIARDVTSLGAAAESALTQRRGIVHTDPASNAVHVAYPVEVDNALDGVVVIAFARQPGPSALSAALRRVHWSCGWLEALLRRGRTDGVEKRLERGSAALQTIAALSDEENLDAALMVLCNEVATRYGCDRVSFGLERRSGVRVTAMSNAAWFQRRTDLVKAIETAMAEALFQNASILVALQEAPRRRVDVAHTRLAAGWKSGAVLSVVVRDRGKPLGVLTLERMGAASFDAATVESAELVAALAGPVIRLKRDAHRWVSGRFRAATGRFVRKLTGPRYPGLKLLTAASAVAIVALALAQGDFRVTARAVVEGSVQRAAVAPFQAFIAQAPVRAGDIVREGQIMALLDDRDLRLERLKWDSERQKALQRQREALARSDRAGMLVAAAQLSQVDAELALVDEKLARTRITAPIDGVVVQGDLSQLLGTPVDQGRVLFEVAPLEGYRIVVQVAEGDVRHVVQGQTGGLALTGAGGTPLPLRVTSVTSVSTPQDGRNFFRVEAAVDGAPAGLRPGMEGVAKIEVATASLLWIWARTTIDRVRLFLWYWLP